MRKIKFKALRTDGKGWVYGDLWQLEESVWISRVELNYEVKPSTVCQYVCDDADGNEVYERDILQFTPHDGLCLKLQPIEVKYFENNMSYGWTDESGFNYYFAEFDVLQVDLLNYCKQTGKNIHDKKPS